MTEALGGRCNRLHVHPVLQRAGHTSWCCTFRHHSRPATVGQACSRCHTFHPTKHTMPTFELAYLRHSQFQRLLHIPKLMSQCRCILRKMEGKLCCSCLFFKGVAIWYCTDLKILFLESHYSLTLRHAALSYIKSCHLFLGVARIHTVSAVTTFICSVRIWWSESCFHSWGFETPTTLSGKFRWDRNASPKFGSAKSNICLFTFRSSKSITHSGSESTFTVTKTTGWKLISVRTHVTRFNHWGTKINDCMIGLIMLQR